MKLTGKITKLLITSSILTSILGCTAISREIGIYTKKRSQVENGPSVPSIRPDSILDGDLIFMQVYGESIRPRLNSFQCNHVPYIDWYSNFNNPKYKAINLKV